MSYLKAVGFGILSGAVLWALVVNSMTDPQLDAHIFSYALDYDENDQWKGETLALCQGTWSLLMAYQMGYRSVRKRRCP